MADKVFPSGIRVFSPRSGAPNWVKGSLVITPAELFEWIKANPEYLKDYNDKKQIKLDLLEGKNGMYISVNTFENKKDDLPF
jgi:hypothetical protein